MHRLYLVIVLLIFSLTSCNKLDSTNGEETLQYKGNWCLFDHGDVLKTGDSVLVFSQQGFFGDMSTLVMKPANKSLYNATYYQGDSLNLVYNDKLIDDTPGPKFFFEAVAFKVDAAKFNRIANKLNELLDQTGPESHIDMIDGSVFFVGSYNGKSRRVNNGIAIEKWREYSVFLQDSVIRPFRELREKGRREIQTTH